MAGQGARIDSVVAVVVVLVVGFTAAAVLPEQPWIEAATWLAAFGVAVAATVRRWMKTDEEELTEREAGEEGSGPGTPTRDEPPGPPPGV